MEQNQDLEKAKAVLAHDIGNVKDIDGLRLELKKFLGQDFESVCGEADRIVGGSRGADYGRPIDDFSKTAVFWSVILGTKVTPEQVALCMVGVKLSRELNRPKRDNLVDGCGYLKCLEMVYADKVKRLSEGWTVDPETGRWSPPVVTK